MQYLSDGEGPWTEQQTEQLTDSYNDVKRSLTEYRFIRTPTDRRHAHDLQRPPRRLQPSRKPARKAGLPDSRGTRLTVDDSTLEVLFDGGLRNAV